MWPRIKKFLGWCAKSLADTGSVSYGLAGDYIDPATMADPVVYAHRTPEDAVQRGTDALRNINDALDAIGPQNRKAQ
jgi:hypothetical protein